MISNCNYCNTYVYIFALDAILYIFAELSRFPRVSHEIRNPELYFSRAFRTNANNERSYTIWDWIVLRNLVIGFRLATCIGRLLLTEVRENSLTTKIFSARHEIICKNFWRSENIFLKIPVNLFNNDIYDYERTDI